MHLSIIFILFHRKLLSNLWVSAHGAIHRIFTVIRKVFSKSKISPEAACCSWECNPSRTYSVTQGPYRLKNSYFAPTLQSKTALAFCISTLETEMKKPSSYLCIISSVWLNCWMWWRDSSDWWTWRVGSYAREYGMSEPWGPKPVLDRYLKNIQIFESLGFRKLFF